MSKDLIILYFTLLCAVGIIGSIVATLQYNKLKGVNEVEARPKLIGALINLGVALLSFVVILLNL